MDIKERFLKYVSFDTTSCEESETVPSTNKQKILGKYLEEELQKMGLSEVQMDENGYVYAFLPANNGSDDAVGFIAHMDT
ncbi:MAG: peptidase T, partial [Oscillospiraceae bacterium]|nr:peptidase T [Oscillospiraceae bacterium]